MLKLVTYWIILVQLILMIGNSRLHKSDKVAVNAWIFKSQYECIRGKLRYGVASLTRNCDLVANA